MEYVILIPGIVPGGHMFQIITLFMTYYSVGLFAQDIPKPDPNSQINAVEQANSLPGRSVGSAYSVKTTKRTIKAPEVVAPVENHSPAVCASSLGGKGGANFTACEAAKGAR